MAVTSKMIRTMLAFCIFSYFIHNIAAQQRHPDNLSTQIKNMQNQNTIPRRYSIFSPITQISRPGRYAKSARKSPRLTKRQYLAEMFKQTAVKNLMDVSNAIKRPLNIPM